MGPVFPETGPVRGAYAPVNNLFDFFKKKCYNIYIKDKKVEEIYMFDKNYVLTRLAAGDSLQTIGDQFAAMLNEAMAEHMASQEKVKEEKLKQIDVILGAALHFAALCGVEVDTIPEPTEEDREQMLVLMEELIGEIKKAKTLVTKIQPVSKKPASDEEILEAFLASLKNSPR